jgi:hypothetical protein
MTAATAEPCCGAGKETAAQVLSHGLNSTPGRGRFKIGVNYRYRKMRLSINFNRFSSYRGTRVGWDSEVNQSSRANCQCTNGLCGRTASPNWGRIASSGPDPGSNSRWSSRRFSTRFGLRGMAQKRRSYSGDKVFMSAVIIHNRLTLVSAARPDV